MYLFFSIYIYYIYCLFFSIYILVHKTDSSIYILVYKTITLINILKYILKAEKMLQFGDKKKFSTCVARRSSASGCLINYPRFSKQNYSSRISNNNSPARFGHLRAEFKLLSRRKRRERKRHGFPINTSRCTWSGCDGGGGGRRETGERREGRA